MPSVQHLAYFLLIGLVAGWLAGKLTKGSGFGIVGNLIVGCIGALLGGILFGLLGFHQSGLIAQIIVAVVGSVVLLFLLSFIGRK